MCQGVEKLRTSPMARNWAKGSEGDGQGGVARYSMPKGLSDRPPPGNDEIRTDAGVLQLVGFSSSRFVRP